MIALRRNGARGCIDYLKDGKQTVTHVTEETAVAVPSEHGAADQSVMSMLHEHVPLTLLCDLTAPEGPESAAILAEEGEPETRWWEQ